MRKGRASGTLTRIYSMCTKDLSVYRKPFAAILDRLLHHSHTINIKGESYRQKEKTQSWRMDTGGRAEGS